MLLAGLPAHAWYDLTWAYRVPISIPAGAAVNSTIKLDVDFAALLTTLGVVGTFDVWSPRVVRADDATLSTTQEYTPSIYSGATNAVAGRGEVRFLLEDAGATTYYLYFDINSHGIKPVNPQTPINGNFERGSGGVQSPPGWTVTKASALFDAQVRPNSDGASFSVVCTVNGEDCASPSSRATDGRSYTGNYAYLLGARSVEEPATAIPSVTMTRTIKVPASNPGNLSLRYRLEGWHSSDDGLNYYDFMRVRLIGSTTTEILGPSFGSYTTHPFSPSFGMTSPNSLLVIGLPACLWGYYNNWDWCGIVVSLLGINIILGWSEQGGMNVAQGAQPWWTRTYDLSAYAGQTVTLEVTMNNSAGYKSWAHLDDVEWSVVTTATLGAPQNRAFIRLTHGSGVRITCTPTTLTIQACQDAACTTPLTTGVSGTLSVTGAPYSYWVDGSNAFTIPAGSSSITKQLRVTQTGALLLSSNYTTSCNFGSPECTLSTVASALLFNVPDHVSETLQTFSVSAVRSSDNAQVCTPGFANVSKPIQFSCAYVNPGSGTLPVRMSSSLTPERALNAGNNSAAACDGSKQSLDLFFDASGTATLVSMKYADVGNMRLDASYTPGSGADANLAMSGSDTFIAAPASIAFSGIPAAPLTAGVPFNTTVTVRNSLGNAAPNFGHESTPATVTVSSSSPIPGAGNATPINAVYNVFASGQSSQNLTWREVGTLNLDAVVNSYLGSGFSANGTQIGVGRFKPNHFKTEVVQGCASAFTYSGQPFTVKTTAYEKDGGITANYAGGAWAQLVTLSAQPGGNGVLANTLVAPTEFVSGVSTHTTTTYTFNTTRTSPATENMRAVDPDGVTSQGASEGGAFVRSGRLWLGSAYGSELLPLAMPLSAQYWNGFWTTATEDGCTAVPQAAVLLGNYRGNLNIGETAVTMGGVFAGGRGSLTLSAPGNGNTGSVDVTVSTILSGAAWMGTNPAARATFGLRKTPIIYMRENF